MMINCQECVYWMSPSVTGTQNGACHAKAPEPGKLGGSLASWPLTGPNEGCGEGELREEKVVGDAKSVRPGESGPPDSED